MHLSGIIGASGIVLSSVFKIFHLMGAPTLLLVGTIGLGAYIVLYIISKIRG